MKKLLILCFCLALSPCFGAVDFDGTDDYIDVGTGVMDFSADSVSFSVSVWINTTKDGSDNYIIGTDRNTGWYMGVNHSTGTGGDGLIIKIDDGTDDEYDYGSTALNDGAWHHVVLTLSHTSNEFFGYVDGTKEITLTTGSVNDLADNVYIGNVSSSYFTDIITEVAIWDIALSVSQIKLLVDSKIKGMPLQVAPANLVGYWPLDDHPVGTNLDGTNYNDLSGNGNDGTGDDGDTSGGQQEGETVLSYPPKNGI